MLFILIQKQKPHRWGFKLFSKCGISGLLYVFVFYEIRLPAVEITAGFALSDFSIKLCIWRCGTIRSDRLFGCRLISDQALKVAGGGRTDFRTSKAGDNRCYNMKAGEEMMVSVTSIVDD
ncbi:hypothetical protein T08_16716 [Trichinella sp. T8]|nr:hypothetical protein T08_16716 [Trichinella sp. T8]